MGRANIQISVGGLDELIDALQQVQSPTFVVTGRLEEVLNKAFAVTQTRVHFISGRLKASGYTETDFDGKAWEGSINYGGMVTPPGYDTPAYYGVYELNRSGTRPDGTPHDFYSGLDIFDKEFEDAIDSHFKILG